MAEDLTRLVKIVRDQLVQNPLPPIPLLDVGTITVREGLHIEGNDIVLSPAALAKLKALLGL